jgi:hypothetical protein
VGASKQMKSSAQRVGCGVERTEQDVRE